MISFSLIKDLFTYTEQELLTFTHSFLLEYYDKSKVTKTEHYIIAEGALPVCLTAHLDTIFPDASLKDKEIYHDPHYNVMWSPDGLGADDRAGVFAILSLISEGYLPSVIFTTKEETGGIGAKALVTRFPKAPFKVTPKFLIELDRAGQDDCVFYNCDNPEFTSFIQSYGFYEDWGTFSDISVLAPKWGMAAVNLSIGYLDEHSYSERLFINDLDSTTTKVEKILLEIERAPHFKYIERKYETKKVTYNTNRCICCGSPVSATSSQVYDYNGSSYAICNKCFYGTEYV